DFEPGMFEATQRAHPEIEFRQGDAQALPFADASFDAVVCSFGILHFPEPERALAEACRVLKRGGRYALTDWLPPAPGTLRGLLASAIDKHGDAAGKLPPGPPQGQFADEAYVARALQAAGFGQIGFRVLALEVNRMSAAEVAAMIGGGLVRTRGLMEAQSPQAQAAIRQALFESARALEREGEVHIPAPAALSWAVKR
ncbi:MAG TPA: methyltransferase domain-containing protein, partial [bacterium]|nr:methyltransferase domain-containing protein [bacterium]